MCAVLLYVPLALPTSFDLNPFDPLFASRLCSEGSGGCTEEQCEAILSPALKKGDSQWGYIKLVCGGGRGREWGGSVERSKVKVEVVWVKGDVRDFGRSDFV